MSVDKLQNHSSHERSFGNEEEEHEAASLIQELKGNQQPQIQQQNLNCTLSSMIAFILLGGIWGSAFSFIKVAVDPKTGFTPIAVVFLRLIIGSIFMVGLLFIACLRDRELVRQIQKTRTTGTLIKMFIMGFFNNSIPFTLVGIAEQQVNSGIASILDSSIPLFCIIFAHFALGGAERITIMKLLGLGIGFGGVILVCCEQVIRGGGALKFADFAGYIMVTGAAASYGVASVFAKKYLKDVPSLFTAAGQVVGSALQMLVVWLVVDVGFEKSHLRYFKHADWMAWVSIAYLAICSTFIAYLCYFYLIRTVGSVKQSMVGYLLPVFGVAEGAIFLREWKGVPWYYILIEIMGAVLVCGGIALVSLPNLGSKIMGLFRKKGSQEEDDARSVNDGTPYGGVDAVVNSGYQSAGDQAVSNKKGAIIDDYMYYQNEAAQLDDDEHSSGYTPM